MGQQDGHLIFPQRRAAADWTIERRANNLTRGIDRGGHAAAPFSRQDRGQLFSTQPHCRLALAVQKYAADHHARSVHIRAPPARCPFRQLKGLELDFGMGAG